MSRMKIEKLDHVSINVRSLAKAKKFFADLLGTEFCDNSPFPEIDLNAAIEPLGIELCEPFSPDGELSKTIEHRGEGVALISFKVPSVGEAIAEMKSRGIRQIGMVDRPNLKEALFHPKDTNGVMIAFIEYKEAHPLAYVFESRVK